MAKSKDRHGVEYDDCKTVIPEFRVSYAHVWKAHAPALGGNPKFSITMLIPKDKDLSGLKKAIFNAKKAQFGSNQASWPKLAPLLKDGDSPKYIDKKTGKPKDGYAGHYVLKASSAADKPPQVVDRNKEEILNQNDFYSGCYAEAAVFASYWEFAGKEGVTLYLNAVRKTKDGKPFGNAKNAKELFGDLEANEEETFSEETEDADFM